MKTREQLWDQIELADDELEKLLREKLGISVFHKVKSLRPGLSRFVYRAIEPDLKAWQELMEENPITDMMRGRTTKPTTVKK